jgi:hypothetical protein
MQEYYSFMLLAQPHGHSCSGKHQWISDKLVISFQGGEEPYMSWNGVSQILKHGDIP